MERWMICVSPPGGLVRGDQIHCFVFTGPAGSGRTLEKEDEYRVCQRCSGGSANRITGVPTGGEMSRTIIPAPEDTLFFVDGASCSIAFVTLASSRPCLRIACRFFTTNLSAEALRAEIGTSAAKKRRRRKPMQRLCAREREGEAGAEITWFFDRITGWRGG
jgi:hypothetical protein